MNHTPPKLSIGARQTSTALDEGYGWRAAEGRRNMSLIRKFKKLIRFGQCVLTRPKTTFHVIAEMADLILNDSHALIDVVNQFQRCERAHQFGLNYMEPGSNAELAVRENQIEGNPLREFFDSRVTGRGIWKWEHYFGVYHQFLKKFIGQSPRLLEIGIYSGGGLDMWRAYLGAGASLLGLDIEEACRCYEQGGTRVFIGDQSDRQFWRRFKADQAPLDIVIDDGGHLAEQQIVTFEEVFPHLRPGGVFICEDIHGRQQGFSHYLLGLVNEMNVLGASADKRIYPTSPLQRWIKAIHVFPFVTVIEKSEQPVSELLSSKHGTEWQPFLFNDAQLQA
ncbi:MAG: class I SAM-dependent methyltransferase [Pirellulales bacterium]